MGKRVNFCKDCKFCSHHKQVFTGWSYYCTNPKVTLCNFIDGREEYVLCGAVRRIDTNRIVEFWKEFKSGVREGNWTYRLAKKYEDSSKDYRVCPLYRKKLTLGRFLKLKFLKLIRYGKKLL